MSLPTTRTTHDVIEGAIRENRFGEYLLYAFSLIFVIGGFSVVIASLVVGREVTGVVGGVATTLFYPAMNLARKMREQNMAIKLLEIPLNNASTSEEAATILQQFFESTFKDGPDKKRAVTRSRPTPKKLTDDGGIKDGH